MTMFILKAGVHPDILGFISEFILEEDHRPLKEQFNDRYIGGWHPMRGFTMVDKETATIQYPGDPPMSPLAWARVGDEMFYLYMWSFVGIVQEDGSFEVARMD